MRRGLTKRSFPSLFLESRIVLICFYGAAVGEWRKQTLLNQTEGKKKNFERKKDLIYEM